jgi:hypothetical protein
MVSQLSYHVQLAILECVLQRKLLTKAILSRTLSPDQGPLFWPPGQPSGMPMHHSVAEACLALSDANPENSGVPLLHSKSGSLAHPAYGGIQQPATNGSRQL